MEQWRGLVVASPGAGVAAGPDLVPVAQGAAVGAAEGAAVVDARVVLVVGRAATRAVCAVSVHVRIHALLRARDAGRTSKPTCNMRVHYSISHTYTSSLQSRPLFVALGLDFTF
jgi:hypothetical protein